jgi:hypothetical protein
MSDYETMLKDLRANNNSDLAETVERAVMVLQIAETCLIDNGYADRDGTGPTGDQTLAFASIIVKAQAAKDMRMAEIEKSVFLQSIAESTVTLHQ